MKIRNLFLLMFCVGTFITSVFAANTIQPIQIDKLQSGQQPLRAGYIEEMPPFNRFTSDVLNAVAARAGIRQIQYVSFTAFNKLSQALLDNKIDLITSNYWNIPQHQQMFLLSDPYYQDGIAFLYPAGKLNIKNAADFNHNRLGVLSSLGNDGTLTKIKTSYDL